MLWWPIQCVFGLLLVAIGAFNGARHGGREAHWMSAWAIGLMLAGSWLTIDAAVSSTPVVPNDGAEFMVMSRGTHELSGVLYATKNSGVFQRCKYLETEAFVRSASGASEEAGLTFVDDYSPGSSRPDGYQSFGLWEVRWPAFAEPVVSVTFEARHRCSLLLAPIRSVVGPFDIRGAR